MEKTVLVTGATGTIGRDVAKILSEKGVAVRAGVRDQAKARTQFGPDIALATFDFEDDASFPDALKGVEKIFLLPPLMPNQVAVTNAFIDETKRAGVRHIVKLSVIGADTDPPYTFGKWHAAADRHIRESGLAFTFLRPNSFMQNFMNYFPPRDGTIYLPWGRKNVHAHRPGGARNRGSSVDSVPSGKSRDQLHRRAGVRCTRRNASSPTASVAGGRVNGAARS
jgi:uncharacterized protein YbjT (DUF2867 family)